MAQLFYRGMLAGIHSWALVGAKLCAALDELGYNVAIQSTNGVDGLDPSLRRLVNPISEPSIGLSYTIPPNVKKLGTTKIAQIYNYETTVLPPGWARMMNEQADLILPSSQFSHSIFAKNGVDKEKMYILPHGFDANEFTPEGDVYNLNTNKFKILVVAAPHARKGFNVLLRAVGEAFASTENVCLVIRTGLMKHKKNVYDVQIDRLVAEVGKQVKLPEVKLVTEELDSVAPLYRACDVMVSTSRSECFCLPLLEAAACKLPIITTGYGGQMDFLNGHIAYPIRYTLIAAPPAMQYWHHDPRAFIAEPDKEHLKSTLRHVFSHYAEAQQKAEKAYLHARSHYTWDQVAQQFVDIVNQQGWGRSYQLNPSNLAATEQRRAQGEKVYAALEGGHQRHIAETIAQDEGEIRQIEDAIEKLNAQLEAKRTQLTKKKDDSDPLQKSEAIVSVVIPVFNQVDFTRKCIQSIQHNTVLPIEIIVVDNNSSDETKLFLQQYPDIKVITNTRNLGFGKAINQGMRAAKTPYVLLLNNDTEVQGPEWLPRLLGALNESEHIGAVGVSGGVLDKAFNFVKEVCSPEETFDYLVGFCMLIKQKAIEKVGYLDERFDIAYYEDVDYCYRLKEHGFQTRLVSDVELVHHGRKTVLRAVSLQRLYRQNRTRFIAKWGQKSREQRQQEEQILEQIPSIIRTNKDQFSIAYVMMDVGLTGGSKIIFEHINRLAAAGHTVNLLITGRYHPTVAFPLNIKPIRVTKGRLREYLRHADIAVATFWPTVYMLQEALQTIPSCKMVYMIQGWEPYFYAEKQLDERRKAEATYAMPMEKVAVSSWLCNKLEREFNTHAELLVNTIDTGVFRPIGERVDRPKKVLFLLRNESVLRGYEKTVSLAQALHNQLKVEIHAFGTVKPKGFPVVHQFHFRPTGRDLAQLYSSCHVYIETSRWQGFGLAPLEAMACGTPCVLSDSGGINEYARNNRNSFIHPFDDPDEQYVHSVRKLLKDQALYQRLSTAAIETARQFDQGVVNENSETSVVSVLERVFKRALQA